MYYIQENGGNYSPKLSSQSTSIFYIYRTQLTEKPSAPFEIASKKQHYNLPFTLYWYIMSGFEGHGASVSVAISSTYNIETSRKNRQRHNALKHNIRYVVSPPGRVHVKYKHEHSNSLQLQIGLIKVSFSRSRVEPVPVVHIV
jgi:hypothetical protein